MAKSKRYAPTERRSWRPNSASPEAVHSTRKQKLISVIGGGALLTILLVGLLVYIWWPSPHLRVAGLVIDELASFASPPIAFAGEDQAALKELCQTSRNSYDLLDIQQSASFSSLPDKLAKLANARDVAVLYVAAHGASLEGKPVILCSDYDPRQEAGRYPFQELVKSFNDCKAQTRLLVLDTGRLEVDLGGGMLLNEFPEMIKAEVSKPEVPANLWVIVANSFLEQSLVSRPDRRSAFNYFFCHGLRGEADKPGFGNNDSTVDLNELANYLKNQVSTWARDSTGGLLTQTPMILQGGKGVVTDIPSIYITHRLSAPEPAVAPGQTAKSSDPKAKPTVGIAAAMLSPAILLAQAGVQDAPAASPPLPPAAAANSPAGKTDGAPTTAAPSTPPTAADAQAPPSANAPGTPAAPADAKAPAASAEPAKQTTDGSTAKAPAQAKAARPPGAGESPETAAAGPPDPLATLRQELDKQRKIAEARGKRSATNRWTPADFAPHLWHAIEDRLADCEARLDAGVNFASGEAIARTGQRIGELDQLWGKIDSRQHDYMNPNLGRAHASLEANANVRAAIQARNDLLNRLPRYIRFYTNPALHRSLSDFGANLKDACDQLRELRDVMERPVADPAVKLTEADQAKVQQWFAKMGNLGISLSKIESSLEDSIVNTANEVIADSKIRGTVNRQALETRRLEALLDSQLLAGETRQSVIDALRRLEKPFNKVEPWTSVSLASDGWQRVADRGVLELKLIELVREAPSGNTKAPALSSQSDVFKRIPTAPKDIVTQCAKYTGFGMEVAKAYAQLPKAIETNAQKKPSFPYLRRAETQMHLVPGRDAEAVDKLLTRPHTNFLAELGIPEIPVKDFLTATMNLPDTNSANIPQLKLNTPEVFEPLTFMVQGTPQPLKELRAELKFDGKLLEVATLEGRSLRSGEELKTTSKSERSAEIALQVKARSPTAAPTQLALLLDSGDIHYEAKVEVLIPKQSRLELVIKGDTAKTWELPDATRSPTVVHGALRPFPNVWVDGKPKGGTNYRIWVHNSAKRKRDLKYRLVALPCEKGDLPRTAEFPWIGEPRLPSGIQTIVPEEDLSLPPEGEIPLPFAPTPKANTPPSVPAAPEGENTPPPEPGMPIEGGLIAIFRDPANSTEEWIWLEVDVLHPDEYLSEPKVIYDGETERIDVSVSPQDAADLPAEGTEITLQVPPSVTGKKVLRGVLQPERPDRIPPLYANVPAQRDLKLRIALDVDGYPRAFIYDVICSGGRGVVPRQVRNFYELQFMKPDDQELFPAIPKLPVQLLVDFPPRDEVESAYACRLLINETQTAEFFHDRRRRVWLLKPQVPGEITLQTAVDDLQVEVRTVEFKNDEVTITSELWFANLDGTSADRIERAQRTVRIDAVNPDIRASDDGRLEFRGEQEQVLLVRFRVIDTNPIKKVQVAFGQIDGVLQGPVEATQVGTDEYQALMPTVGKSAGTYQLHAQATDAAGNVCSPVRMTAYITARASPKSDTKTNDLSGTVVIGGQAARGIQMSLVGPISATTASGENGSYKFTEVPAGAYKLSAKGNFKNAQYSGGPIDVLISPPPAPPTELGPIALTK